MAAPVAGALVSDDEPLSLPQALMMALMNGSERPRMAPRRTNSRRLTEPFAYALDEVELQWARLPPSTVECSKVHGRTPPRSFRRLTASLPSARL